jgi:hypothetical protein
VCWLIHFTNAALSWVVLRCSWGQALVMAQNFRSPSRSLISCSRIAGL